MYNLSEGRIVVERLLTPRRAACVLLAACLVLPPAAADTVYLLNGKTVSGTVTAETNDGLTIKTSTGTSTIPRDKIDYWRVPRTGANGRPIVGADGKPVMVEKMFQPRSLKMPFTITTDHYIIKTDISDEAAKNIARAMEKLHEAYAKIFHPDDKAEVLKADVAVFEKKHDFLAYAKRVRAEPKKDTLGFYRARTGDGGEIITYKRKDADNHTMRTLYHESTHQFVIMLTGIKNRPPLWVNEGLAVYFEPSRWHGGKFRTGLVPKARLQQVQKAIRSKSHIHLSDLVQRKRDTFDSLCYAESWSLVHFFVKANGGRYAPKFRSYFRALKAGENQEKAFKTHLTKDFGKLERLWKSYVLSLKPNGK